MNFDYYYGVEAEQFAFYRIPRMLIKDERFKGLSSDAKILYGLMLDRMSLSMKNGWIDEDNRVYIYYTVDEVIEDLRCTKGTVAKIFAELDCKKGIGLIEKKRQGQGKPDCIYVKNFVSLESEPKKPMEDYRNNSVNSNNGGSIQNSEVQNLDFKKSKNYTSRSPKNEPLEVQNLDANKNYNNKTDINNIYNINHVNQSKEYIDMIDEYKRLIAENIQYDMWMNFGKQNEKEMIEEIYQIICDIVIVNREFIKINGLDYPYKLVKAQFLKINYNHIEYTLECLKATTSKINNIRAYLITTLFNAVGSMNCYYQQQMQHDLYGKDG